MTWKPLCLSSAASAHLPPFLISTAFEPESYTVHLTDLTHIWNESLSRREIVRRSQEEGTSINPSDSDQLGILLQKVKLGLDGKKNTVAALTVNGDDGRPGITLNLTVELPGGLAPLEWSIRLAAAPQTLFTSQLTIPLIEAQQARIKETEGLVGVLRDKDHIIQKLLDKLESQGTELGQVFPQAAGKAGRKVDRLRAEERVKGLAPFSLKLWRQNLDINQSHDAESLISEVFTSGASGDDLNAAESWWEDIKGLTVNLNTGKISTNLVGKSKPQNTKVPVKPSLAMPQRIGEPSRQKQVQVQDSNSSGDDGAFQIQSTPPYLASRTKRTSPSKAINNSSTDSDDGGLDAPSQHSEVPDSFPISQPQRFQTSPSSPPRKVKKPSRLSGHESTTDDEAPLKPPNKIGAIGGKKITPKRPILDDTTTDGEAPPPISKRVGAIGGKKGSSKASPSPNTGAESTEDELPPPPKRSLPEKISPLDPDIALEAGPTKTPHVKKANITEMETALEEASPAKQDSPQEPAPKTKKILGKIGGKKAPELELESSPPSPKTKKGVIGQIGGKQKIKSEKEPPEPVPPLTLKSKPGAVGGRKATESPAPEASRGRTAVKEKDNTPEARETSKERADKKRLALKQELEAKANAPVKKKRKF